MGTLAQKLQYTLNSVDDIQKALECIINDFIQRHNLNINLKDSLSLKIKSIREDTRIEFSAYFYAIAREINSARNFEQHKHCY